ncbi:hypothetical protein [Pseudomonas solani]|uniref:hypothetical protein n=1 Tax=Pseudomonas solani TaxID=2731552 RepID=UPI003D6A7EA5
MSKDLLRFLPPEGQELHHISRTDGHSIVIHLIDPSDGKDGTSVPVRFRKDAVADGCRVVGMDLGEDGGPPDGQKTTIIVEAIKVILERKDEGELNGDGRPNLNALKKQAGFGVTRDEFEAAWEIFEKGLDDDGQDD